MPPGRRGAPPRQERLTRGDVVGAAVRLALAEGIAAVTLRRVAAALGVTPMAVYAHVRDKSDLLAAVVDAFMARIPWRRVRRGDWKAWMRESARVIRTFLVQHPDAIPVLAAPPVVTRATLKHVERTLAVLRDSGFDPALAVRTYGAVSAYTIGYAVFESCRRPRGAAPDRGGGDRYWTFDFDALPPLEFPTLAALSAEFRSMRLSEEFESGLERLLRSLDAERAKPKPGPSGH